MAKTPSIRPLVTRTAPLAGEHEPARRHRRRAERHVDEEDPVPAQRLGQHPAEDQAQRRAARAGEAVDAHRLRPVGRRREQPDDHAEAHRGRHRAARALDESRRDQHGLADRQAAHQRRDREQDQARQEDALAADQVAEPAGEQQQAAEGDQVPVHHPLQAGRGEAQVPLDRRQGHGHDGPVEDDHQGHRAEHGQRQPARLSRPRALRARLRHVFLQ
jgi:hypothetical protein